MSLHQRLAATCDLLNSADRHWHAAAVSQAIERITNQDQRIRRLEARVVRLEARVAELQEALDEECIARDRAEA